MKATSVTLREVQAARTLAAGDFLNGPDACVECGLAPVVVRSGRRPDPHAVLLEPVPTPAWRRARTTYRCRDREACARRWRP